MEIPLGATFMILSSTSKVVQWEVERKKKTIRTPFFFLYLFFFYYQVIERAFSLHREVGGCLPPVTTFDSLLSIIIFPHFFLVQTIWLSTCMLLNCAARPIVLEDDVIAKKDDSLALPTKLNGQDQWLSTRHQ